MSEDVLIIGGGPAGASAAFWLARAGRKVLLLEKERQPSHKLCAELIGEDACLWLAAMGIDPESLGAVPLEKLRLVGPWGVRTSPLGFSGFGLSRRVLDHEILKRAEQAGAEIALGQYVRNPEKEALSGGKATRTLIATGRSDDREDRFHLKTYFRLAPAMREELAGHFEVIWFPGGYACLQMVEREMSNLTVVLGSRLAKKAEGAPQSFLNELIESVPHLAMRTAGAVALLNQPLVSERGPIGQSQLNQEALLGDAMLIGGAGPQGRGVGFALHSGRLAAKSVLLGDNDHQQHLARDGRRVARTAKIAEYFLLRLGSEDQAKRVAGEALALALMVMPSLLRQGLISKSAIKRAGTD